MNARTFGSRLILAVLAIASAATASRAVGPEDSIVRVTSVLRLPNPLRPWTRQNPAEVGGTGVVIETINGTRIQRLRHLVETLRDCKDEFLTFRFAASPRTVPRRWSSVARQSSMRPSRS